MGHARSLVCVSVRFEFHFVKLLFKYQISLLCPPENLYLSRRMSACTGTLFCLHSVKPRDSGSAERDIVAIDWRGFGANEITFRTGIAP